MKQAVALFILATLLFTGGCGFKDIDKRFFVTTIGIDWSGDEKKPYRVSLKLGIPSAKISPGKSNKFVLVSDKEETIAGAIRMMKSKVDKEIDFSHAKIIVFGMEMAKRGIWEPMDWLMRRRDIQLIADVAIGVPNAKKILGQLPTTERLPGNDLILSFNREGTESTYIVTEMLFDLNRRLNERGYDAYLPIIRPHKDMYLIDQVAVLRNKKVNIILSAEHTRQFNELVNNIPRFQMLVKNKKGENYAIQVIKTKMKFKVVIPKKSGPPVAKVNIKMTGFLEEGEEPLFGKGWKELEREAGVIGSNRFEKLQRKMQKKGLDPIGFGLRYRAMGYNSKEDWEWWKDQYPNMKLEFDVKVKLVSTGVIK